MKTGAENADSFTMRTHAAQGDKGAKGTCTNLADIGHFSHADKNQIGTNE